MFYMSAFSISFCSVSFRLFLFSAMQDVPVVKEKMMEASYIVWMN